MNGADLTTGLGTMDLPLLPPSDVGMYLQQNFSSKQGGIMTGNLGTRFPRNLHPQPKYFVGVPLFDKICIDMNVFELKMIK